MISAAALVISAYPECGSCGFLERRFFLLHLLRGLPGGEHTHQRLEEAGLRVGVSFTSAALAAYRSNQLALTAVFEARHAEVEAQRKLLALQRDLVRTQAQLNLKPIAQGGAQ